MPALQPPRAVLDAALGLVVGGMTLWSSRAREAERHEGPLVRGRFEGPPRPPQPVVEVDPWQLAAVGILVVALALRRTAPRTAYLGTVAATALYLATGGPYGPVLLGAALAVHAVMTRLPPRQWLVLLAAVPVALSAGYWREPAGGLTDPELYLGVVLGTAGILLPGLVGLVVAGRRDAQRESRLEARRRQAYEERLQIAREVHDVVGHSLAVINLQAGVALHVLEKRPDQLSPALEAIRTTSKTALAELAGTLATFRGEPGPGDGFTAPGRLADLDGLVAALRAAGRPVDYSRPPAERLPVTLAVEHAALRIAQEGLTNVVRHAAADARTTLTLSVEGAGAARGGGGRRTPGPGAARRGQRPDRHPRPGSRGGRHGHRGSAARRRVRRPRRAAAHRHRDGPVTITVGVADDQQLIRLGLRVLLESEDDLELAWEAENGRQALDRVRSDPPDVVLMDLRMPVLDGLAALQQIAADPALAAVRVVVLTTFESDDNVFAALRAGAAGSWSRTPSRSTCCGPSGWPLPGSRCCPPR